jgi:dihydrofolate reductase
MEVIIIAAMAANRVIGKNGTIPWYLPEELQWFKATTMGHPLIMGRKTCESIGRPLPGRTTIVVSRHSHASFPGCTMAASLTEALCQCAGREKVFIAGGAQIYALALPFADTILLSVLDQEVAGDTFFPPIPAGDFIETSTESIPGPSPYTRITYQRRK